MSPAPPSLDEPNMFGRDEVDVAVGNNASSGQDNADDDDDDVSPVIISSGSGTIDNISVSSIGTDRASNHHRSSDNGNDAEEELRQLPLQPPIMVPATVGTNPSHTLANANKTSITTTGAAITSSNTSSSNIGEDVSSLGDDDRENIILGEDDGNVEAGGDCDDEPTIEEEVLEDDEDYQLLTARTLSEIRTLSEMALSVHNNSTTTTGADAAAIAAVASSSQQQQPEVAVSTPSRLPSLETSDPTSIPIPILPATPLSSPRVSGGGGGGNNSSRLNSSSNNSSSFNTPITSPPSPTPSTPLSFVRLTSNGNNGNGNNNNQINQHHHQQQQYNNPHSPYVPRPSSIWSGASPFKSIIVDKAGVGGGGSSNSSTTALARQLSISSTSCSPIRLGICAMDKKARSKPMKEILKRLDPSLFEPVYFGDEMILNMPVESWPIVDVLIAFYSNGYPLEKAEDYVSLRRPYLLNCLATQRTLMDRRRVYDLLEECGIDVPRHVFVSRDGYVSTGTGDGKPVSTSRPSMRPGGMDAVLSAVASSAAFRTTATSTAPSTTTTNSSDVTASSSSSSSSSTAAAAATTLPSSSSHFGGSTINKRGSSSSTHPEYEEPVVDEHDDHIEVNGVTIHKPFVEKPVDADDHNIAIYYPSSAGGGCKKLFRKVGDRSSEFYPEINEIRRDGSYIYEEFMETQGVDVKMYTVGPDYGHAEARKSPAVDGKVERNADGKEVRFPVILTLREKEIARR